MPYYLDVIITFLPLIAIWAVFCYYALGKKPTAV